ncbi:MAG: ABC transporter permease [Halobacteriaceae archaeon]
MATDGRHYLPTLDPDTERRVALLGLAGVVAALVFLPVVWLLLDALSVPFDRVVTILTGSRTVQVLLNSLALVTTVTIATILLGVPLALLTVRTDLPFHRAFTVAVALPLVVPSYIGAFAFASAFGPGGLLTHMLAPFGIETIPALSGFWGTTVVLTLFTYPYVFITTRASLLAFDTTLVDAARTLNHSRRHAFRRVTLPQIAPGIAAGALLVALYTLSDFGTPAIMRFDVFTRVIYVWSGAAQQDVATLLSLVLVGVTVLIIAAESRLATGDADGYAGGPGRGSRYRLGRWRWVAAGVTALVASVALLLPVAILVLWLFQEGPAYAAGGFDFEWRYALNSVYVSLLAAGVAVLASLPVGYLSARHPTRVARVFDRATYVGYAVPGVVIGLALVSFSLDVAPWLYRTIPVLVFAYVVRFVPQAVGATRASVLQVDRGLLEAARTLGRPPTAAFRRVVLPLIAPGLSAGAALVFLTTMKELPATLLLAPPGYDTIVTFIWRVRAAGYYGEAAVPALLLVLLSAASMAVILRRGETDAR